jgi:hypothetical protein
MPAVGDWVVVCDAPGDRFAIEALLPRRTKVSRKTPWLKAEEHILVANVDTVVLVSGLDADFNRAGSSATSRRPGTAGRTPSSCSRSSTSATTPACCSRRRQSRSAFPCSREQRDGRGLDDVRALPPTGEDVRPPRLLRAQGSRRSPTGSAGER